MALPRQPPLQEVLREARKQWTRTADDAQGFRDRLAAGNVSAGSVLAHLEHIRNAITYFEGVAATPGISAYATDQYGSGYAIGPDFTAFITALEAVRDWIVANFPTDGSDYLLEKQIGPDGAVTVRQFAPAQTAALRTLLDTLVATVEP